MGLLRNIFSPVGRQSSTKIRITPEKIAFIFSASVLIFITGIIFRNQIATFFSNTGADPIAYWKFDEGQGLVVRDSMGSNNGTLGTGNSAPTWVSEDQCITGKCLRFDGTNDYVRVSDDSSLDTTDITFQAWIKFNSTSGNQTVINKKTAWNSASGFYIEWQGSSNTWSVRGSDGATSTTTTDTVIANTWNQYSFVISGTSVSVYKNGIYLVTTGSIAQVVTNTQYINLGSFNDTDAFFRGYIDEAKIYDYARTAAQIKADYAARGSTKGVSAQFGDDNMSRRLSDGLVGYWRMDETTWSGANAVLDSSGNMLSGTALGGAAPTGGKFGNAGSYDNSNNQINIPSNSILRPTESITVSAWVNSNGYANGDCVLNLGSPEYGFHGYYLRWNIFGFQTLIGTGSTYKGAWSPTFNTANTWVHVVGMYDGQSVRTYVNGVSGTPTSYTGSINYSGSPALLIGINNSSNCLAWNGEIDEVRIYNRALDSSEVQALYEWAPGPVGYWKMDEASGSTIADSSGNGNNGTTTGSPTFAEGKYGKALSTSGSTQYVTIADSDELDYQQAITISFWMKPANATDIHRIIRKGNPHSVGGKGFSLLYRGDQANDPITMQFNDSNNSHTVSVFNLGDISNTWTHVAVVCDKSALACFGYKNGIQEGSGNHVIGDYTVSDDFEISSPNTGYNGLLDDVKVYNYVRTQEQIVSDMNAGHPAVGSPVGSTVLHLKMDEGYGNIANDYSPQNNNGNILGSSAPSWTNDGKFGKALSFDGGDYIRVPNSTSLQLVNEISVSVWIKLSNLADAGIVSKSGLNNSNGDYALATGCGSANNNQITFGINGECGLTSQTTITTGEWYHLVGTYDGTALRLYVNGDLDQTLAETDSINTNSTDLIVGGYYSSSYLTQGTIDDLRIYPFALSESQVKTVMNQGEQIVMGAGSTDIDGTTSSNSGGREYCVPGDTSVCNAPIGEWNLDENTGTSAYDTSGNNNTGTLTGGPKWIIGIGGKGSSVHFDGGDDAITIPDDSVLDIGTSDFTLSAWVKGNNLDPSDVIFAKSNGDGCSASYGFHFGVFTGNLNPAVHFCTGGGSHARIYGNYSLTNGVWYHISAVIDRDSSTNSLIYVNGRPVSTSVSNLSSHTGSITNAVSLAIGAESDGNNRWNGTIDQIKIYDYARTSAQIAWEYNRGAAVAHYKLDECTGTTIYDSSGNKLNGTLSLGSNGVTSAGTCSTSGAWASGAQGKHESSLSFDGSDDYVDMGNNLEYPIPVTVSAWIKVNSLSSVGSPIFVNDKTTTTNSGIWFLINQNGSLNINYGDNTGTESSDRRSKTSAAGLITIGTWYHVAGVIRGQTDMDLYINGGLVDGTYSGTGGATIGYSTRTARIGMVGSTQNLFFNGQIDDLKVFNYALTKQQIQIEMAGGAVRFE